LDRNHTGKFLPRDDKPHTAKSIDGSRPAPAPRRQIVIKRRSLFPGLAFRWQTVEPAPIVLQAFAELEHFGAIFSLAGDPSNLRF